MLNNRINRCLVNHQVPSFAILLMLFVVFFDNFIVDSVAIILLLAMTIGFFVYIILKSLFFLWVWMIHGKRTVRIYIFDFVLCAVVAICASWLMMNSYGEIREREEDIGDWIVLCMGERKCDEYNANVSVKKDKDVGSAAYGVFYVTYGIITIRVMAETDQKGCYDIFSYGNKVLRGYKCSDKIGTPTTQLRGASESKSELIS